MTNKLSTYKITQRERSQKSKLSMCRKATLRNITF